MAPSILQRVVSAAEQRFGVKLVERNEFDFLTARNEDYEVLRNEAEELGYHALSYFTGRPTDLRPESRNRLSQRSRIALMQDPLAGAEAELKANFAFGRGIALPDAEDEAVQKILEEAWTDPVNWEKLTSFEAQRHRSNELITQANLYPAAYVKNGYVRIGFLDADTVKFIVPDPEDEERPLYYATIKRRIEWDFQNDRLKTIDEMRGDRGKPKVVYYPHWRHVEDMEQAGEKPPTPPNGKQGDGLIYHVRINRIGRSQFGTPPWARTLRFFRAMNDLTEAHVVMAQAASTFVAKQTMKGTPKQLTDSANAVLAQTGELGAARFGETPTDAAFPRQTAPPPGSFWLENESNKLEALQLNSGAAQAAQTAQIVRAPIAASGQFGQHYFGDAGNANLATATSLELPTLMAVQAWQETFKQLLTWFCDLVIQEAVRSGRLGGYRAVLSEEDAEEAGIPLRVAAKALSELTLSESADKQEMERRTGKKLGYTLSMPYPGRRNLPDVVSTVTGVAAAFDPNGVNVPLRRHLLTFLATHGMQMDDPQGFVDEVLPEDLAATLMPGLDQETGDPYPDTRALDYEDRKTDIDLKKRGGDFPKGERPARARTGRTRPRGEMGEELEEEIRGLFDSEVLEPLLGDGYGSRNGAAG